MNKAITRIRYHTTTKKTNHCKELGNSWLCDTNFTKNVYYICKSLIEIPFQSVLRIEIPLHKILTLSFGLFNVNLCLSWRIEVNFSSTLSSSSFNFLFSSTSMLASSFSFSVGDMDCVTISLIRAGICDDMCDDMPLRGEFRWTSSNFCKRNWLVHVTKLD